MKYPLEDLLRVRRFREDDAANVVVKHRAHVSRAEQDLANQRRALVEFSDFRVRKEASLYDEIMNQQIVRKDLDNLHAMLQELKLQEDALKQKIVESELQLNEARKALQEAQLAYRTAVKAREKLDEHKSLFVEASLKEEENFQEKELEDFRVKEPETEADAEADFAAGQADETHRPASRRIPRKTRSLLANRNSRNGRQRS